MRLSSFALLSSRETPLWSGSWWRRSDIHGNWRWSLLNFSVIAAPRHDVHPGNPTQSWRNQTHNLGSHTPIGRQHKQRKLTNSMWHVRKISTSQQNILTASTLCLCPYPGAVPKRSIGWVISSLSFPCTWNWVFYIYIFYICNAGSSEI